MTSLSRASAPPPGGDTVLTWPGILLGFRLALPAMPGILAFSVAFGAAASHKGLSLWQSVGMSAFVSAGASQILSLELWRERWTLAGLLTVALVTATVNARFLLQGASLQPWLRSAPALPRTVSVLFLFEASWIVAERHRAEGGRDLGVFLGSGILCWVVWVAATVPGYLGAALLSDPRRYALDLVLPLFFASMAVPLWRGLAVSGRPWAVAAAVGLLTHWLVPGYVFIVAGALAGAATGALSHVRR